MEPFAVYLLVGIAIFLIGIFGIGKGSKKKKRCTASAAAMIVEIEKEDDESAREGTNKKYSYTPIYEFTANGTTVKKSGGIYSHNKNKFHIGDTATVMYNPENPEEFVVDGKSGEKGFGIALILFGLLIIALSFTQK